MTLTQPKTEALPRLPLGPKFRLGSAAALGLVVFAVLPAALGPVRRGLFGWDVAVLAFIILIMMMMATATQHQMRRRAARQDQGRFVVLAAVVAGSLVSMISLAFIQSEMKAAQGGGSPADLGIIVATILLSWFLVHIVFTLHYAHVFYGPAVDEDDDDGLAGGLDFPGEKQPDYGDFMYFSFVVGMTCQVSDVQITDRGHRRLALMHGIVSFFFNTIILALTINIVASLI